MSGIRNTIKNLQAGQMALLHDDLSPEGPIFLISSAARINTSQVAHMVNISRGVTCISISEERAKDLGLEAMAASSGLSSQSLNMTLSVEARHGVTTGISASDRAITLRTIATTEQPKVDLVTPGHIFPVQTKKGGVLVRDTAWEASVDLMILSGETPACAISHCLDKNGALMKVGEALEVAKKHGLSFTNVSQVVTTRLSSEVLVEKVTSTAMPLSYGEGFRATAFRSLVDNAEHLVLSKGLLESYSNRDEALLVRVQAENRLGDLLGWDKTDSHKHISGALAAISKVGAGIFVYVRHPRKKQLSSYIDSISSGKTTQLKAAQLREYGVGAQILRALGVKKIKLLSNSEHAISGAELFGLEIVGKQAFSIND